MMKDNLIISLLKGFIAKSPKRLAIVRNILIIASGILWTLIQLQSNGVFDLPDWVGTFFNENGIWGMLLMAAGVQFAKKNSEVEEDLKGKEKG